MESLQIMDKKKDAALAAEPQPFMTLNVTDWHNGTKSYAFDGYPNNLPIGAYPLYTAPAPQREWQGLTENDWDAIQNDKILIGDSSVVWAIRLTETLLRAKNEVKP